ncbi:hypothetical protein [Sinorhizobium meliloti]|uniref:portal protein n=1 Tax=Rhizobium meliloti TaxID=382 RepID=UPI00040547DB|nr:hypothetical protein [Sinorhizobium meliloti]MDW9356988.1 hypothetical protein [Sinorhizobium meliloti]MDW9459939.1 hypothetical protein [Sinorhizobium meliloti]MDW9655939.1 hypothetical protein [Sinorhizobium meliloti]MDW9915747.1 hypothetical protein [Sinorhizobium meliloti]MDW9940857.1 hypothetical protein [Sinorhizobium meliloti]
MAAMTDERLSALVSRLVKDCEDYRDELAVDRIKAMEYYDGTMKDVPADANRSKVVSRDVRAAIKKVLPSLIRTILGNDKVVEFAPVDQGDEAAADQATDYIIGQTELMVRTFAQGLKRVFQGLLRLVVKHQDRPRMVRLRGQWVTFDPRQWNAGMDATVNTGLGAGTRERDMMMIQMILQLQEKLLMTLGPDNPYVSPDNLYNGIAKSAEAAGLKSPDLYFTKPAPEEIQRRMQAAAAKPDPEMQKLQMQAQAEAAKAQLTAENERRKLEIERELKLIEIQQKGALTRYQIDAELNLKRQQNAAQLLDGEPLAVAHIGGMPG